MQRLNEFDTSHTFEATVKESERITPDGQTDEVRHIVLDVKRNDVELKIGQNIGLVLSGQHEFGNEVHFRLYTIAGVNEGAAQDGNTVSICVRRCTYIDPISGERIEGVASNYLCDRQPGDTLVFSGPYGNVFRLPDDKKANILMVGLGTGIAPFRAFVKHIYGELGGWEGKVRLFYGAKTGLELLYMNDKKNDIANYYDESTFKAFEAVSPRPALDAPIDMEKALEQNAEEVWAMIQDPSTHVYVAGQEKVRDMLDKALAKMAGSEDKWQRRKRELEAGERWAELLY